MLFHLSATWEPPELWGGSKICSAPRKCGQQRQPVNWGRDQSLRKPALHPFPNPLDIDTWVTEEWRNWNRNTFLNISLLKGVNKAGNRGLGLWLLLMVFLLVFSPSPRWDFSSRFFLWTELCSWSPHFFVEALYWVPQCGTRTFKSAVPITKWCL